MRLTDRPKTERGGQCQGLYALASLAAGSVEPSGSRVVAVSSLAAVSAFACSAARFAIKVETAREARVFCASLRWMASKVCLAGLDFSSAARCLDTQRFWRACFALCLAVIRQGLYYAYGFYASRSRRRALLRLCRARPRREDLLCRFHSCRGRHPEALRPRYRRS
jgi:hypothetical protein